MRHSPASIPPAPPVAEPIERRILLSTTAWTVLTSADFNADGAAESVVRINARRALLASLGFGGTGLRRGSLAVIDVDGALIDGLSLRARGNSAPLAAAGDFDGDGTVDLVVAGRRLSGFRQGLALLAGNGDGTFGAARSITGAPANVTSLVAGDFNGDGRTDLAGTGGSRSNGSGNGGVGGTLSLRLDEDSRGDTAWTVLPGDTDDPGAPHRPHPVGAGGEAGGAVLDGSAVLPPEAAFGGSSVFPSTTFDTDVALAPGFTPPAAQAGATAETGGARLGGSDSVFADGSVADDRVFVLLGNGDGTFSAAD
jgi:hypothetical protein